MPDYLVFHRFPDVVLPADAEPLPTGMQGMIFTADDAQTAVDVVLDGNPFHQPDTVFAIDLATAQEFAVTHSHDATPA